MPAVSLWAACALGVSGVCVLRRSWSLPARSAGWNTAGWLLIAGSVACGWSYAGAWGVAVAALVTTAAAFVALTVAGITAPAGRAAASNRRAGLWPQAGEPRRIGRRVATFGLVVPGGLFAALALAFAARGMGMLLGAGEANANVAALFTVPIGWAILMTALLMQARRRAQWLTLTGCAALGAPFVLTGLGS